jgi:hypothetical protein
MKKLISLTLLISIALIPNITFADPLVGTKVEVNGQTEVVTDVKRRPNGDIKKVETVNTETGEKVKTKAPKKKKGKKGK